VKPEQRLPLGQKSMKTQLSYLCMRDCTSTALPQSLSISLCISHIAESACCPDAAGEHTVHSQYQRTLETCPGTGSRTPASEKPQFFCDHPTANADLYEPLQQLAQRYAIRHGDLRALYLIGYALAEKPEAGRRWAGCPSVRIRCSIGCARSAIRLYFSLAL